MPTQTAETVHGSVEYETVECASCGNETVKDDAKDFQIGDREGKACEHCYKEGPISFPEKAREWVLPDDGEETFPFFLVFAVLVLPMATLVGFHPNANDFTKGYATAVTTILLYTLGALGLWWLV